MRERNINFDEKDNYLYDLSDKAKSLNATFTYGEVNEMLAKFNKSPEMKMIRNAISMDTAIHLEFETSEFIVSYYKEKIDYETDEGKLITRWEKELYIIDAFGDVLIENVNGKFYIDIIQSNENHIGGLIKIVLDKMAEKILAKFEKIIYSHNGKMAIAGRHNAGSLFGWLTVDKTGKGLEFLAPYEMAKLVMEHEVIEIQKGLHALKG